MSSLNVLLIIHNLADGGAERVAANMSLALAPHVNVTLAVYTDEVSYPYAGDRVCLDEQSSASVFSKLTHHLQRIRKLKKLKRERSIDVSVSLLETTNFLNVLSRTGERVILTHHNVMSTDIAKYGRLKGVVRLLMRVLDNRADAVVGVSEYVVADLKKHFGLKPEKARVIYNSFDVEKIRELAAAPPGKFSKLLAQPCIVNAGRLSPQKGQSHLLRVFSELRTRVPEAKLLLLGEGELKQALIQQAESLGLRVWTADSDRPPETQDLIFAGFQSNPYPFFKAAALFAFPSVYEGFGNVLIEAMACGAPAVSADCIAGPREILEGKSDYEHPRRERLETAYGLLLPVFPETPSAEVDEMWVETLHRVLSDRDHIRTALSAASPERARAFSDEVLTPLWLKVLQGN